jgi:hypothetical protein
MTPDERAGLIARLDTYNDQLAEAAMQLDYGSLDRAADLAALYEDRAWVEELEPPKTHDKRGRPLNNPAQPDSRNRFARWLRECRGLTLVGSRSQQLLKAHEFLVSTGRHQNFYGEQALRPLYRLQRFGLADRLPEVLDRAAAAAASGSITSEHTRQAVRDFLAEQPKVPKATVRRRKVESECEAAFDKVMEDVWAITIHGPEGRPYLERVMAFLNRQLQEIPAQGGNLGARVKAS